MSGQTLLYEPLNVGLRQIRLLELPAVSTTDAAQSYRLITVSLLEWPRFFALSYVWGKTSSTEPILLNGITNQVTNNLASALRHIVHVQDDLEGIRWLWADAVCINQDDLYEKSHQISLMKDIYSSAHSVISWLGTETWISTALETLRIIWKEASIESNGLEWLRQHRDLYVQDKEVDNHSLVPNHHWESLRDFARLNYWARMWIFQEIVLSRRLVFITPGALIYANDLESALARTRTVLSSLGGPGQTRPDFISEAMWEHLTKLQILGDRSFKLIERLLVAKRMLSKAEMKRNERPAICILSSFTNETRATDERDYYYSLIGVSELDFTTDYRDDKSIQSVCVDFVGAYLTATRDTPWILLFLHDAVGQQGKDLYQLPSWAPMYHLPQEMGGRLRNLTLSRKQATVFSTAYPRSFIRRYVARFCASLACISPASA